jgi:predicted enzyme related to lactoylglutathione lyase
MQRYAPGTFNWVDFNAHDMGRAKQFYAEVFGWTARDEDTGGGPPYAMFTHEGRAVAGLGQMSDEMKSQGAPPTWNTYVAVADAAAVQAAATEAGGAVVLPEMKVMSAGTMSFLSDPEGAVFATWQADEHPGAELVNAPGAFCWNELCVRDVDRATSFYGALFGWSFREGPKEATPTRAVMIHHDGRDIGHMLEMNEQWAGIPAHWQVYFSVEDADEAVRRVMGAGGKVMVPPMDIPPGRFSVVSDSQGGNFSVIALRQR